MTAREHCASRRATPFGAYRLPPEGSPQWKKLGHGYLAVVDGTQKAYVASGLIFAVEIHDNIPQIYSYIRTGDGLAALKPYAARTLYHMLATTDGWSKTAISYDDLVSLVCRIHPATTIPEEKLFWREWGIMLDVDGKPTNILNLDNDKD